MVRASQHALSYDCKPSRRMLQLMGRDAPHNGSQSARIKLREKFLEVRAGVEGRELAELEHVAAFEGQRRQRRRLLRCCLPIRLPLCSEHPVHISPLAIGATV